MLHLRWVLLPCRNVAQHCRQPAPAQDCCVSRSGSKAVDLGRSMFCRVWHSTCLGMLYIKAVLSP